MFLLFGHTTSTYPYFLCTKKYILLKWIDHKAPTIAGRHFYLIPMEHLTYWSKGVIKVFYEIWPLFLEYISKRLAATVLKGLVGHN